MVGLDRHIPRLCHSCGAPIAGGDDDCWKCGAPWSALLAEAGGGAPAAHRAQEPLSVVPAEGDERAPTS